MKHLYQFSLIVLLFSACKKETHLDEREIGSMERIEAALKDSLPDVIYQNLDLSNVAETKINEDTSFLRIGFKGKALQTEFVLLQVDTNAIINRGRIISLFRKSITTRRMDKYRPYNGTIIIRSLKNAELLKSDIVNGYIVATRPVKEAHKETPIVPSEPGYVELPEVVVIGQRLSGGGMSFTDWINFGSLFAGSGGGSGSSATSNYYGPMDGSASYENGGGGGGSNTANNTKTKQPVLLDYEEAISDPPIDLAKYLKCFTNIPDAGSTCSIEIFADIPVDSDPNKLLNWQTGSPGHVFLQLTKTNGRQYTSQIIGFYPKQGWKVSLSNAPVNGKFVDNSHHEFNASLRMNITAAQQENIINLMLYLSKFVKYDIDEYNCTDFALEVFNSERVADPIKIPLYQIPGGITANGSSAPQGLFNQLKQMKQSGHKEANNISIPGYKGYVPGSKGPCN